MRVYGSDDYYGLDIKGVSFYCGYEETFCKKHGVNPHCEDEHECDKVEWCFVVRKGKKEVMRIPISKIENHRGIGDNTAPIWVSLFGGIGLYLESQNKKR